MELKVIGAGFGRTGTLSLKLALDQLGFGPCYHMAELFSHPEHAPLWLALAEGKTRDWSRALEGYHSVVDWPTTYFWREFAAAYPKAKVILTERDTDAWFKSADRTIFQAMKQGLPADADEIHRAQIAMAKYIVADLTFHNDVSEAHAKEIYRRHNEEVKRTIAADRLLVFDGAQGWAPLCAFLGVPVPSTPYPNTNTTEEFRARSNL